MARVIALTALAASSRPRPIVGFIFGLLTTRLLAPGETGRGPGAKAAPGRSPTTEMRTGLVSGTVNTDIVISIDRLAETNAEPRPASGGRRLAGAARPIVFRAERQEEQ
jgi:hypothetical protein